MDGFWITTGIGRSWRRRKGKRREKTSKGNTEEERRGSKLRPTMTGTISRVEADSAAEVSYQGDIQPQFLQAMHQGCT